jgi:hypothetical protein
LDGKDVPFFAFFYWWFFPAAVTMQQKVPARRADSGTVYISCDESFKPVIDAQLQVSKMIIPKQISLYNTNPKPIACVIFWLIPLKW